MSRSEDSNQTIESLAQFNFLTIIVKWDQNFENWQLDMFFFLLPPSPRPPGGRWDPVRDKRQENPSLEVFNLTEITNKLTMSMALIFQMLHQYHQTMCCGDFRTFKVIALDSLTQ